MIISFLGKLLVKGGVLGAFFYLLTCFFLQIWQNRLIFMPSAPLESTPRALGLDYEDVWIPLLTGAGKLARLHGWWLESDTSQDVFLYLHGNGGNISANLAGVQRFYQMGFSVLIVDYRGYGLSKGDFPSEVDVYQDSQFAWHYLVQKRAIKPENIFIYGHSLGGAIAIDLAVRQPLAAGVIVESSFTSMKAMADNQGIYRFLPINCILTQKFDSLSKLSLLKVPLLLIHGAEDRTVPARMSQELFARANGPKQLLVVAGAGHNNVASVGGRDYHQTIINFRHYVRLLNI